MSPLSTPAHAGDDGAESAIGEDGRSLGARTEVAAPVSVWPTSGMPNEPDWNAMAEDLHVIRRYLGWIILLLLLPFFSAIVIALLNIAS